MAYASPYYDPQKAHEYYEQHKKLKGKTVRLNDKGKAAVAYVKETIKAERTAKIEEFNQQITTTRDNLKSWAAQIAAMPSGTAKKEARAQLKAKRAEINEHIKGIRQTIKDTRAAYKTRQEQEIAAIKSDKSMIKGKSS